MKNIILRLYKIKTPIGEMTAIADENLLYLLQFTDQKLLKAKIKKLELKTKAKVISGKTSIIILIEKELEKYFAGELQEFKTPIFLDGTDFQKDIWNKLKKIPFGHINSYLDLAILINKPNAFRAVALANAANKFSIIIPCHRVINKNGNFSGYNAGVERKKWLLEHERTIGLK